MRCFLQEQFDRENDIATAVQDQGRILFRTGAMREMNIVGRLDDPPTNPLDFARQMRRYWKIRGEIARRAFQEYKAEIFEEAEDLLSCGGMMEDAPAKQARLLELRGTARAAEKEYEHHDAEIRAITGPPPQSAEGLASIAANREDQKTFLEAVGGVEI